MTNPAQWASFDNWSVQYADYAKRRITLLQVPTVFLQRWWRQRHLARKHQRLVPIIVQNRAYNLGWCADQLLLNNNNNNSSSRGDSFLQQHVFAYEKLDGTNLGVRCDGAVFGRRQQVIHHENNNNSYHHIPLEGIIPNTHQIHKVKVHATRSAFLPAAADQKKLLLFNNNFQLIIYGELMVNPGRFGYDERAFAKKWIAFGLVFQNKKQDLVLSEAVTCKLSSAGFLATMAPVCGKITVRLNPKLARILNDAGIATAPLLASGPLCDVCLNQLQETLMQNDALEGVVLTGQDLLVKWKTGKEDNSQGYQMLTGLMEDYSTTVLQVAGVNEELLFCLKQVAGNRSGAAAVRQSERKENCRKNKTKICAGGPYDIMDLERELQSAMTKYDTLGMYFAQDKMGSIIEFLIQELKQDLGASAPDEMKCIERYVKKVVGKAFGAWKRFKT